MKIFSGNAHPALAEKVAAYCGVPLGGATVGRFPDGEIFVKFTESLRGQDVFIIQPTAVDPNEYLMELLIMTDAAKRASAARITAVIPFYAYARQDRKDQPRVPVTAKLVANLLVSAGVDRVLALDLHSHQIQGFFDIPLDHLRGAPVILKYIKSLPLKNLVVVSPDPGGLKMAYLYADALGAGVAIGAKQRKSATEVEMTNLVGDVEGCDVVLVDDMTTTAGTLCEAAMLLKKKGANCIYAATSHALLTVQGLDRLKNSVIRKLITTDSVPQVHTDVEKVHVVSVAGLIGEGIRRIHDNMSVSTLFELK